MINNLRISNFKCFSDISVNFRKANLFLGTNSGGKSSLIQSILLAKMAVDSEKSNLKSIDVTTNNYNLNLYGFDEIIFNHTNEDCFSISIKNEVNNISINFMPTDDENVISVEFENEMYEFDEKIIYLSAERSISQNQKNGNIDNITLGKCNEYIGYIVEKGQKRLIEVDINRNHWSNREATFLDIQINNWLNYILPNNRVTSKNSGFDNHISLLFGDKTNLHQTNIGYGISFVLPIIVAGLIAKKGSIIIIENPELHLHPQAQSRIASFLAIVASAGVQVIIETHSEHIVNGFRKSIIDNDIPLECNDLIINYCSVNEKCDIEEIILNDKAEITHWPDGFMDQEQKDLFEIRKMRLSNGRDINN